MPLHHIEHVLIQPADMEATARWWCEVLGMREGPHPDFKFPVKWLYIGDTDVVHLTPGGANTSENRKQYLGQQSEAVQGSGVIDHIAFRCTGLRGTMEHLRDKGVEFRQRRANGDALFQLFLLDPNGVKVELNFDGAEAAGIEPELMASALPA